MKLSLALDKMTVAEKLAAMEQLWDDLCKTPDAVKSPPWHGRILAERKRRVREGNARFSDLPDAVKRIRKATRSA